MRTKVLVCLAASLAAVLVSVLACRLPLGSDAQRIEELEATITELSRDAGEQPAATNEAERASTAATELPPGATAAPPSEATPSPAPTPAPAPTPTPTATPTPAPTATPAMPELQVALLGCDTGFDIAHGMWEVTNAYVTVQNVGAAEATNMCAELQASDVDERHPDETQCVQVLLPQHEVSLKLTADTEFGADTSIIVVVTADGGVREEFANSTCDDIDLQLFDGLEGGFGTPVPF